MPASNTYESISSVTLTNATNTVTFSSIPQTFTDLVLIGVSRASTSGTFDADIGMRFNSDSATNYSRTRLSGNGTTASSLRASNETSMFGGFHPISTDTAGVLGFNLWNIMNYSNSTTYKTVLIRGNSDRANGNGLTSLSATLWRSTSAVSSLSLILASGGSFASGSTFTLYGIKAA